MPYGWLNTQLLQSPEARSSKIKISSTPARKTSDFFDSINNLDPMKFSPPEESKLDAPSTAHNGHLTYTSVANLNPFQQEERCTTLEDFINGEHEKTPTAIPPKTHPKRYVPPFMNHSRSEGNIGFQSGVSSSSSGSGLSYLNYSSDDDQMRLSEDTSSPPQSRGRSTRRAASPSKDLADILEIQPVKQSAESPPKRSRSPMKRLFAERGWFGKSMSMTELPNDENRRLGLGIRNLKGKLVKGVENLTENVSRSRITTESTGKSKSPARSTFHVSLSPPMQAKLYSELELMICATANQYLRVQVEKGRMSIDSLQKVIAFWTSKNRPQVIDFMYDQVTQRDLILYNMRAFRFYGPQASNLMAVSSMMQAWKCLAREMAIRTFCTPDSVVKKHLQDTYRILEMLGAPLVTFLAFQEIATKASIIMIEERRKQEEQKPIRFGIERQWEPPKRSKEEIERLEMENPFA